MAVPSTGRTPAVAGPLAPLEALDARVREAVFELPSRERRALRMRESEAAPYAVIAESLGADASVVAPLLLSARAAVRAAVRGKGLPGEVSPECGEARLLLCARQDGEATDPARAGWLREHVDRCDACRATRLALREASVACRGVDLGSVTTAPTEGIAVARRAAEAVQSRGAAALPDSAGPEVAARATKRLRRGKAPAPTPAPAPPRAAPPAQPGDKPAKRRRTGLFGGLLMVLLLAGVAAAAAFTLQGGESARPAAERDASIPARSAPSPAGAVQSEAAAERRAAARRRRAAAERRRRARARARREATPTPAAATEATPTPAADDDGEETARDREETPADENAASEIDQPDRSGAGLPARTPEPTATNAPGQQPVQPDPCSEDSPDCESG